VTKRGKFIVIEGIDGAGTTTVSRALSNLFNQRQKTIWTCEPSKGPVGSLIRLFLTGRATLPQGRDGKFLATLFTADRLDHCAAEIEPALARGEWVVCDRYYHSTYVYNCDETWGDFAWLYAMNQKALKPDITVLLDVDTHVAAQRRGEDKGRTSEEIYEDASTQALVNARYRGLAQKLTGENFITVDASKLASDVVEEVHWQVLSATYPM
jgi:dTMP kinase